MLRVAHALFFATVLLLTGATAAHAEDALRIANPWVSLPIFDEAPRVYLAIQNATGRTQRIVAAKSPRCRSIELRLTTVVDGRERSKKLDEIEIPPGGAVALAPRGYFLELVDAEELAEGDRVAIELELAGGSTVRFEAMARDE